MEFEGRRKIGTGLDIAPLVDVVFLLLIFFLLTSQFVRQPGMKIELPRAKAARAQDRQDIVVTVTREQRYFLNGESVAEKELMPRLCRKIDESARRIVIVKADRAIPLQPVVTVMDYARQCRAEGITISTKLARESAK